MNSKNWLLMTFSISLSLLSLLGISMYLIDPYNYYGNNSQQYLNDKPSFAAAAALRQETYNTAIIGSSLSLGIQEEYVDSVMNCESLNLSYSGCTAQQRKIITDALAREGRADTIICDLLLSNYVEDGSQLINEMQMDAFPTYLFDSHCLNDIKYLYNYDILFKMMPRIIATKAVTLLGKSTSKSYFQPYDEFHRNSAWPPNEDWTEAFSHAKNPNKQLTPQESATITANMRSMVDAYITEAVIANPELDIVFYFPPYSALYWYEAREKGYMDILLDTKEYIFTSLSNYDNVTLYDFQTLDIILDLQYYHDGLHYTAPINELIIDSIHQNDGILSAYEKQKDKDQLIFLISSFRNLYNI